MLSSSIVLLTLSFAALARCELTHYITYKSFCTALHECGEYFEVDNTTLDQYGYYGYPCTPEVKKLIHCALVNLGAWNDITGVRKNVIQFLFEPNNKHDNKYEERTECCLNKICKNGQDQNHLAYETFSCYYHQYGRLQTNVDVYVPMEELQYLQFLKFVANVIVICPEKLKQFARGDFLDDPLFKQAIYIGSTRQGAYSLKKGFVLEVGYAQYNIPELMAPCTKKCVAAVSAEHEGADHEELVYLVYRNCFHKYVKPILAGYYKALLEQCPCGVKSSY